MLYWDYRLPKTTLKFGTEFTKLLDEAASLELAEGTKITTKAAMWTKMGMCLIKDGVPHKQIGPTVLRELEKKITSIIPKAARASRRVTINTAKFYEVMSVHGWLNMERGRPTKQNSIPNACNDKYPNAKLRRAVLDCREALASVERSLRKTWIPTHGYVDLDVIMGSDEINRFLAEIKMLSRAAADCANNKNKIPPTSETTMRALYQAHTSLKDMVVLVQKARLKIVTEYDSAYSPKEAGNIIRQRGPDPPFIYKIKNRDEAIFFRFTGMQCTDCGGWRLTEDVRDVKCESCGHIQPPQTLLACPTCQFPFYSDVLEKIEKGNGECPECSTIVRVPPHAADNAPTQ